MSENSGVQRFLAACNKNDEVSREEMLAALEKYGERALRMERSENSMAPFLYWCCYTDELDILLKALERYPNRLCLTQSKDAPLQRAVKYESKDIAKWLILQQDQPVDVNADEGLALKHLVDHGDLQMFKWVIENSQTPVDVAVDDDELLCIAIRERHYDFVDYFLDEHLQALLPDLQYPIVSAAMIDNQPLLDRLLALYGNRLADTENKLRFLEKVFFRLVYDLHIVSARKVLSMGDDSILEALTQDVPDVIQGNSEMPLKNQLLASLFFGVSIPTKPKEADLEVFKTLKQPTTLPLLALLEAFKIPVFQQQVYCTNAACQKAAAAGVIHTQAELDALLEKKLAAKQAKTL